MSASEFGHWLAFFAEESYGPGVQLTMWAEVMAALHNGPVQRKSKALFTAADFIGKRWAPPAAKAARTTGLADLRRHVAGLDTRKKKG